MEKITGIVLVRETNSGVSNLVVTAFDSERSMQDIISENHTKDKGFDHKTISNLGKRIGSVLTSADGSFSMAGDDLHSPGNEIRPDLILVVFAPEDIQDIDKPYPLPPEKRILYISTVPRIAAGNEEVYVIRLLQLQLDKYKILSATSAALTKQSEKDSNSLSDAIENSYQFKENLKSKLKTRLNDQEKKAQKRKQDAVKKTKDLSTIPLSKRDHPFLVRDQTELKDAQKKSITQGLKNLHQYKPKTKLTLTSNELKSLGISTKKEKFSTDVNSKDLAELISKKIGGVSLVRTKTNGRSLSAGDILKKYLKTPDQPVKAVEKKTDQKRTNKQ